MTSIPLFKQHIQACWEVNNSWHSDLEAAKALHTLGGDWQSVVEWIPEMEYEQVNLNFEETYDSEADENEEVNYMEMAELALNDWVEENAKERFFGDDLHSYDPLSHHICDEDERFNLYLDHAEKTGDEWKVLLMSLEHGTEWFYDQDRYNLRETMSLARKALDMVSDDYYTDLINEFVVEFTNYKAENA